MAQINGRAVNFGFVTTTDGITISGLSGVLLQSADQSKAADVEIARNGAGEEVTHGWYNIHDEATLEYVVAGTGLADAIANTVLQSPGTFVNITACASMPTLVATTWEVQPGCKITKTNTNFAKISIPLKKFTNITAAAGA